MAGASLLGTQTPSLRTDAALANVRGWLVCVCGVFVVTCVCKKIVFTLKIVYANIYKKGVFKNLSQTKYNKHYNLKVNLTEDCGSICCRSFSLIDSLPF